MDGGFGTLHWTWARPTREALEHLHGNRPCPCPGLGACTHLPRLLGSVSSGVTMATPLFLRPGPTPSLFLSTAEVGRAPFQSQHAGGTAPLTGPTTKPGQPPGWGMTGFLDAEMQPGPHCALRPHLHRAVKTGPCPQGTPGPCGQPVCPSFLLEMRNHVLRREFRDSSGSGFVEGAAVSGAVSLRPAVTGNVCVLSGLQGPILLRTPTDLSSKENRKAHITEKPRTELQV